MLSIYIVVFTLFFNITIQLYINDAEFQSHMKRIKEFPCKYPRPTAIKTNDLIKSGVLGKRFIPEVTVLYRCDQGSGCCFGGKICGPNTTEEIDLKFLVSKIDNENPTFEIISVKNHTKCECFEVTASRYE